MSLLISDIEIDITGLKDECKSLEESSSHLTLQYDAQLDIEDYFEDFENYIKIWKFSWDWIS